MARADDTDPSSPAYGTFKPTEQVVPFQGSFSWSIPIDVPGFHGIAPGLSLGYSSEGGNGLIGAGWGLAGFRTIERMSPGRGTPRFDATDIFVLDGQELLPCSTGITSPSCSSGGTHASKTENYLKIVFDSTGNTWTVRSGDGTRTIFSPTLQVTSGTLRWGQTNVVDMSGNPVSYNWACLADGDCYPNSISYGPYVVTLYRETRPDILSFAARDVVGRTTYRLRSILVGLGSTPIRAYKLTYTTSALTTRSLLTSVQQYGSDVVIDASGGITGGSSLPAATFTYQGDTIGKTFQTWGGPAPTAPGTSETISGTKWANLVNAQINTSSLLQKNAGGSTWNGGASSSRSLAWGDGYAEFTASTSTNDVPQVVGLSKGDTDATVEDVDFGIKVAGSGFYAAENGTLYGPWTFANGDRLRVEVSGGAVYYKRNGVVKYTSTKTPTYPLLVDTSLYYQGSTVHDVVLSGALQDAAAPCDVLLTGDFNGDGRTDLLCYVGKTTKRTSVSLATATGFSAPATWLTGVELQIDRQTMGADFDGDGKTDLSIRNTWDGSYSVALSTGTSFSTPTQWGTATATYNGSTFSCKVDPAYSGAGDFNGDGRPDVWCKTFTKPKIFVGLNTGQSFTFSIFGEITCDATGERPGAMDFTGDGKDDWFCIGGTPLGLYVYPNDGTRFTGGFQGLDASFCDTAAHYVFGDYNGDGRPDAACMQGNVALSTGHSFVVQGNYGSWCLTPAKDYFASDVDGDGRAEIVCNNKDAGPTDIQVRKWTGSTLAAPETWKGNWCQGSLRVGDFNGDGKPDLHCSTLTTPVAIPGTDQVKADLLTTVQSPLGGRTQVTYTPSTIYPNQNNPGPKYVVTALTTDDGRGGVATSTYSYSGGAVDRQERRFLGFRDVKQTLPCVGTDCPTIETWFKQDLASVGKPERVVRADASGHWLTVNDYTYTTSGTTVPWTSLLTATMATTYDDTGIGCASWPCPGNHGKRTYTTYQYDTYNNLTQKASYGDYDASGDEVTTAWSYSANTTSYIVSRPSGVQTFAGIGTAGTKLSAGTFAYSTYGLLTASSRWLDTGNRNVTRTFTNDGWGNQTSVTDETNRQTTITYDSTYHLFPTTVRNAAGETTTTQWNVGCAIPTQQTDPNGQVTTTQPDAFCRAGRTDLPLGSFVIRSYPSLGNPTAQYARVETPSPSPEDGTGNYYSAAYFDGFGRTYRTVKKGPSAIAEDTSYDARGRAFSRTAPYYSGDATYTTTYGYDSRDRITMTQYPDGNDLQMQYDVWSWTTTDEHGHPVTLRYDAYGREIAKDEHLGAQTMTTQYSYDLFGGMTGMTDALGNAWSWRFDSLGRNWQQTDPDSGTWTFAYDDAGRQTSQTDAKGQRTDLGYDSGGRLASKVAGGETTTLTYGEVRTGYFNVGRLTTVQSPRDTLQLNYDALGRTLRQVRTFEGISYALDRRVDAGGFLRGITYPDGDAVGTSANPLLYDSAGRPKMVPGVVTEALYDASGRPTRQTNANGTVTTSSYAPERGFLTHLTTLAGSRTVQDLAYTPDTAGLVTQVTSPLPHESWTYGYDDLHRTTSATSLSDAADNQTFVYDEIGRLTYNSRIGTYTYPGSGSPRPHGPTAIAGTSYNYDANGNLLSGGGRTVTWNADNLPVQMNATQFLYDGTGTRLKKATGASTSVYPLGDDYEVTNAVITKYISVDGLGMVAKRVGSQTFWLHTDRLGSIQAITDGSGAEVQRRSYRPYGDKIADSTSHVESRGYIGQRQDTETGVTYLHARYFDSARGLFLSPDPLHPARPGVGPNRYSYAHGNPINGSDPSGLMMSDGWTDPFLGGGQADPCANSPVTCFSSVNPPFLPFGPGGVLGPTPVPWPGTPGPDPGGPLPGEGGGGRGSRPQPPAPPAPPPPPPPTPETPENDKTEDPKEPKTPAEKVAKEANALLDGYVASNVGCAQSSGSRFTQDFLMTNQAIPGLTAPTGLGMVLGAGGAAGRAIGAPSLFRAALGGAEGVTYAGGVTYTSAEALAAGIGASALGAAAVGSSFEIGVMIGSAFDTLGYAMACP